MASTICVTQRQDSRSDAVVSSQSTCTLQKAVTSYKGYIGTSALQQLAEVFEQIDFKVTSDAS